MYVQWKHQEYNKSIIKIKEIYQIICEQKRNISGKQFEFRFKFSIQYDKH